MSQRERGVSMYSEYRTKENAVKFDFGTHPDNTIFSTDFLKNGGGSGGGSGSGGNGGGSGGGGGGGGNGGGSK